MSTQVESERDTKLDYDLIHSQQALMCGLVSAVCKVEGCSPETAEYALSISPDLAIDIDYDPPLDSGATAVLEGYWGQLLGGREDIRIGGMRISRWYSLLELGLGGTGYEVEIMQTPDWIVDSFNERAFSAGVFINQQTGVAFMKTASAKDLIMNNKAKPDLAVAIFPPKILTAFANILYEEDPHRMKLVVSAEKELRQLNTPPFNRSRDYLERLWSAKEGPITPLPK